MKTKLIVVGKTNEDYLERGVAEYRSRLKHYLPFEYQELQVKTKGKLSPAEVREKEGKEILNKCPQAALIILLDEKGKRYSSVKFAGQLQKWMNSGQDIIFVIGGAYGFSDSVYQRAGGRLSLSDMTFSHQMIRLFFVEQLYRAMTILKGEKYHNP